MTDTSELRTHLAPHELDASLRLLPAVEDAIDQLTKPRLIHTEIRDDGHGGIIDLHTEQHPALIDLLEHGTGSTNRGRSSGIRIPIDAEAHELHKEIRAHVRTWLRTYHASTSRDLKDELQRWATHHDNAVHRGHVTADEHRAILRRLEQWVDRIDAKFDPDEHREWTDACPALLPILDSDGNPTGELRRCNARKHLDNGELKAAIDLNVTRWTARCRTCGTRWDGHRGLMQLRYESNLREQEQAAP